MGSRGSFDIDTGVREDDLEEGSLKSEVYAFITSTEFTVISNTALIVALFLEDLRRATMDWQADRPVQIISLVLFIFFFIELILQLYVGMDYFYIILDAVATGSLVFDFLPLLESPTAEDASKTGSDLGGSDLRAWRVARAGSKAGRLIRLLRIARIFKAYAQWTNVKDSEDDEDVNDENVSILGEKLNNWMMRISLLSILFLVLVMAAITPQLSATALEQARSTSLGILTSKYNASAVLQSADFNATLKHFKDAGSDDQNKLIWLRLDGGRVYFQDATYSVRYEKRSVESLSVCCSASVVPVCSEKQCEEAFISEAKYDHRNDEILLAWSDLGTTLIIIFLLFAR